MFKFTRDTTEYTVDFNKGIDDNLLLCFYFDDGGNKKWLVVKDTDDLLLQSIYPDQSDTEGNAYVFMDNFIKTVNKALDTKHGKAPTNPKTAKEWVGNIVDYKLSFDGEHLEINK